MKNRLLCQTLVAAILLIVVALPGYTKPTWTFSVVVAVEKQTAHLYESMLSKPIDQIVRDQMTTVNANFNRSPNFNGIYAFRVDSVYVFDESASTEIFRPHPNYTYGLVIDGFSNTAQGGGWLGGNQVIYHKWSASKFFESGPFGPGATDGLTHEFAHARGAVDIYGMRVEGSKNPVNGETFEPVNSIMNYPYGNIVWDEYTTNLLNSTAGGGSIVGENWITKPFPGTIMLKAINAQGQSLENVLLEMYPVDWFSYSASPTPILQYSTMPSGSYIFSSNPFQPSTSGYPWTMRYSNFLIKATYQSTVVYKWLPLYDVQNDYFRNGPQSIYTAVIQFPADMPFIHIDQLNNGSFTSGEVLSASFSVAGSFKQGNTFALQVIDQKNNTSVLQTVEGTKGSTLTGHLPTTSTTGFFNVRITSSDPVARSSDYTIIIFTDRLQLLAPFYDCESGKISFNTRGGDNSTIRYLAPGIRRTLDTDKVGFVEEELRRDPKMIPISATQNGYTVTTNFDLRRACGITPRPPVLTRPIPDQVFTVGQIVPGSGFAVGSYFEDPTPPGPGYSSEWDFQVDGLPNGLHVYSRSEMGGPNPIRVISGTPVSIGVYTVRIKATTAAFRDKPIVVSFKITISEVNPGGQLTVLKPTYDCGSGRITFNTSGGDGSPITYQAPGIIRAAARDNFGTVEAELRGDPKPITIQATQGGHTASYQFDFQAYCTNPDVSVKPLLLLAPTYNCQTGAITFNTSGGDGSVISFMAPGITGWTTNANQYVDQESRTAEDVQPFLLTARQNGVLVTYRWNLRQACGRARQGNPEVPLDLRVTVLGNPLEGQTVELVVSAAANETVQLSLTDLQGRLLHQQRILTTESDTRVTLPIGLRNGLYLLDVSTRQEHALIRLVKP